MSEDGDTNQDMAEAIKQMDPQSAEALKQAMKQLGGME